MSEAPDRGHLLIRQATANQDPGRSDPPYEFVCQIWTKDPERFRLNYHTISWDRTAMESAASGWIACLLHLSLFLEDAEEPDASCWPEPEPRAA